MKKRRIIGAVTALGTALSLGGCFPQSGDSFDAENNYGAVVYGPPEWFEDETTAESTAEETSETTVETTDVESDVFETSTFKPELNTAEPVYGPPEWFDESETEPVDPTLEETTTADTTTEESTLEQPDTQLEDFDPELNESFEVYGPPEWFNIDNIDVDKIEEALGEYFPFFTEEQNIPDCVYGPPEWFEGGADETDEQQ